MVDVLPRKALCFPGYQQPAMQTRSQDAPPAQREEFELAGPTDDNQHTPTDRGATLARGGKFQAETHPQPSGSSKPQQPLPSKRGKKRKKAQKGGPAPQKTSREELSHVPNLLSDFVGMAASNSKRGDRDTERPGSVPHDLSDNSTIATSGEATHPLLAQQMAAFNAQMHAMQEMNRQFMESQMAMSQALSKTLTEAVSALSKQSGEVQTPNLTTGPPPRGTATVTQPTVSTAAATEDGLSNRPQAVQGGSQQDSATNIVQGTEGLSLGVAEASAVEITGPGKPITPNSELPSQLFTRKSGSSLGRVTQRVREKILTNEYFDLGILLENPHQPSAHANYIVGMDQETGLPTITYTSVSKPNTITTYGQWSRAFRIFISVYTQKFPLEAPALMKYMQVVESIAREGGNWKLYDENFRYDRQTSGASWDQFDFELFAYANLNRGGPNSGSDGTKKGAGQEQSKQPYPKGFCFKFQEGAACNGTCGYKHECPNCGGPHRQALCVMKPVGASYEQRSNFRPQTFLSSTAMPRQFTPGNSIQRINSQGRGGTYPGQRY